MKTGIYRHYKGNMYRVHGFAKHSETLEVMVQYQALYGDYEEWTRPLKMFSETVVVDGKTVPRFELFEPETKSYYIELDSYEISNLRAVLDAAFLAHKSGNPLSVLNNGDWTWQVLNKLPANLPTKGSMSPNHTPEELVRNAIANAFGHAKLLFTEEELDKLALHVGKEYTKGGDFDANVFAQSQKIIYEVADRLIQQARVVAAGLKE